LFDALGVSGRILLQLAKLTAEVRQLRHIVERQASTQIIRSSTEEAIPVIAEGPVNTIDNCRTLLNSCGGKAAQDYLVSNCMLCLVTRITCAIPEFSRNLIKQNASIALALIDNNRNPILRTPQ
jgi:hypothetical protein